MHTTQSLHAGTYKWVAARWWWVTGMSQLLLVWGVYRPLALQVKFIQSTGEPVDAGYQDMTNFFGYEDN